MWAAFDGDDGMSRYYVHKVISLGSFTFRILRLNPKTNSELDPLTRGSSGLSKLSADFPVGKYEVRISLNNTMSSYLSFFTHDIVLLNWNISLIVYKVYVGYSHRGKREVWALFRIWSLDWNELTTEEIVHKYDMVDAIEDFGEDQGVLVTPLVKVASFSTIFDRIWIQIDRSYFGRRVVALSGVGSCSYSVGTASGNK